jgi:hypothetical protein
MLPLTGVEAGASLAGNDSSEASCTASIFGDSVQLLRVRM